MASMTNLPVGIQHGYPRPRLDLRDKRILHFNITKHPTSSWIVINATTADNTKKDKLLELRECRWQ
jgi:hypothetical protein